jgi:hypothetical protein
MHGQPSDQIAGQIALTYPDRRLGHRPPTKLDEEAVTKVFPFSCFVFILMRVEKGVARAEVRLEKILPSSAATLDELPQEGFQ